MMMGFLSDANGSNATTDDTDYVGNGKKSMLKQQRGQNYAQMRAYANDPTIDKGLFPSARKKHERELNAERKKWREEFELEAEKRREKKEKEDETKHRERDERRRLKATAFKNTTGEREALKKENDKRREEKRGEEGMGVTTTFLAATKRRSSKLVVIQTGRRRASSRRFQPSKKESVAFLSSDDVHGREIQQKQPTRAR